ncbi:MAG: DUF1987 domain-containing protein [Bacteroidota bacterium]
MNSQLHNLNTSDRFELEGGLTLPKLVFDPSLGLFCLEGKCIPENPAEFFQPVMARVDAYMRNARPFSNLIFRLEYFNTASRKYILEIARKFERLARTEGHDVLVSWYCEPGDTDMEEAGLDYRSILRLPVEVVTEGPDGSVLHRVDALKFDKEGKLYGIGTTNARNDGAAPAPQRIYPEHTPEEFAMVTNISDRLQNRLNQANGKLKAQAEEIKAMNESLELRNRELQQTIDALTKSRAGRRATTAVLIIALILFCASEGIEYFIEQSTQNVLSLTWILTIKLLIALLIKPIESLLETYFIKQGGNVSQVNFGSVAAEA